MDIEQFFSHIRNIKPDEAYTRRSREMLLGNSLPVFKAPTLRQFMLQSFQFVSAVGLSLVLLILVGGGFTGGKMFSPAPVAGLDVLGIQAEAQAVDVQIRLTDVGYSDPIRASSPAVAVSPKQGILSAPREDEVPAEVVVTSTPKGVDDALRVLSE